MKASVSQAASRRIKSLRMKTRGTFGRSETDDHMIPLDLSRDPNDLLKEILSNLCSKQGVSTPRKLAHLNNLVRLYCSIDDDSLINIPMEVIMCCLKATLVSDVKEVRAAGVRALRYIINDQNAKQSFMKLHLDFLITKCLDISHFNEVERIQAIRLVRKLAHLEKSQPTSLMEPIVPLSLFACIVSVSLGGAEERDRVYRTCLAVLCELAVIQPSLLLRCNGVLALINAILECHMYHRISECLCMSLMHLIDHPTVRESNLPELNMGAAFAPFTELNYRLHPDVEESKLKEEQEMRFMASKMAIVSLLRTWSGMLHVCNSESMVKSFVEAMLIPSPSVRRGIMAVLCDLFYFNELNWTEDFDVALKSAAPGNFKDTWRLSDGFVVAEAKCLLPVRAVSRPDLVDCQLAILLSAFLKAGLTQSLATVSLSTDRCSSVASTILLGMFLHLASRLLPGEDGNSSWKWHLPDLLRTWSTEEPTDEQLRINIAVKQLQEIHVMLQSRTPAVYTLYLSHQLTAPPQNHHVSPRRISSSGISSSRSRSSSSGSSHDPLTSPSSFFLRRHRSLNLMRDFTEDHTLAAVKSTRVLITKENREWDWEALECLFLSPPSVPFLRSVATDDTLRRFYRRLIYFYLPSSKLFSAIDLSKDGMPDHNRKYVTTACYMVQFLAHSDEEGQRLLKNMISTIVEFLTEITSEAAGYSRSSGSLAVTCTREYFLILGALSCDPRGDQVLGHCKAYHCFLGLATEGTHDTVIKLLVSSLHFSEDSPSRAVLSKVLTSCNEAGRLYGTGFLRVLLRADCPGFRSWGTDLLTTQLFDKSNEVAAEALDILHEACDDKEYLRAVVKLRPSLLHLGERGAILVCRFLSEPQGFAYLSHNRYLARELDRWWKSYNERYVIHVEELLKLSLTTYERPNKEEGFVRRSGHKKGRQSVYLPAHLYGELCRHKEGLKVIEGEKVAPRLTKILREMMEETDVDHSLEEEEEDSWRSGTDVKRLLKMKSCLWALAHIGSTVLGLPLLQKCHTLPLFARLASDSPIPSVRGTAIYCLSCMAQTIPGVEALGRLGWKSVLKTVNGSESATNAKTPLPYLEPEVTPRMTRSNLSAKSISTSSQWSTTSSSPYVSSARTPRRSASNASTSSRAGERLTRSRASSRTDSGSSSSSKIKRKNSKKNSIPEDTFFPSPSTTSASTSVVSSEASIFDVESQLDLSDLARNPSPPGSRRVTHLSFSNPLPGSYARKDHRKHSKPALAHYESRGSFSGVEMTSSKSRIRDKVFDFFRKGRSRSSLKPNDGGNRKRQLDESSSGYESDPHRFENNNDMRISVDRSVIVEDKPSSDSANQLLVLTSYSQSNASVDTLKVIDVAEVGAPRPASVKRNSSDFSLKTDLSVTPCNAVVEMSPLSSWNANNSGQSESVMANGGGRTHFYVESTEYPAARVQQRAKRTQSLPNVLNSGPMPRFSPGYSKQSNEAGPENPGFQVKNENAESPSDYRIPHWRSDGDIMFTAPFDAKKPDGKGETFGEDVTDNAKNPVKSGASPAKTALQAVIRRRGNTEVSHDSGCVIESTQNAMTSSIDDDRPGWETDSKEGATWKLSRPTGLAAVRMFNLHTTSPLADLRKSLHEQLDCPTDALLSAEDRDEIVTATRYVGIALPESLSAIFQPLNKELVGKPRSPANLLTRWKELIEDDGLPDVNPGRQKVNELLQGRKFRGLDEYTFGPAVAAALKASSSKPGKSHSTVNTPCARTPDSIMSEASDLCYLGGQTMEPESDEYVAILHQEIVQLVTNLGSSVGIKAHETALLMMKEKRPEVFDSVSLYNSIVEIMSEYSFRLTTRRFVQELFQDVHFTEVYHEAQRALQSVR